MSSQAPCPDHYDLREEQADVHLARHTAVHACYGCCGMHVITSQPLFPGIAIQPVLEPPVACLTRARTLS